MSRVTKAKLKRSWQDIAKEAQDYRDASIAQIKPDLPQLPTSLRKNVLHIPSEILTQQEIALTETPPEDLLILLSSGKLTATAVTEAFLRRAALAQKLVRLNKVSYPFSPTNLAIDKLHNGASPLPSSIARTGPRHLLHPAPETHRPSPWPPHQRQRAHRYERPRSKRRLCSMVE